MNEELKNRLVQMVEEENRLRTELASDGSLYEGYPKYIRELHLNQAYELVCHAENKVTSERLS